MLLMFFLLCCGLLFLFFTHPLWLSLMVFISSIVISLLKFFQIFELGMFSYLFIMIYSGGLLLLLIYMSSLLPNNNLSISNLMMSLFGMFILIYSMYKDEFFFYWENPDFSIQSFLGMSYFMNHKDLFYALVLLLLFSFVIISFLLSHLKYPMRSL
uniref:NADH dehydrogenase subunit 6 n=1 Tax=Trichuris discolor TaxID=483153 RepID=J7FCQ1_9BILA|nr:NADH dehydrogenase subunit 6 [Trichuris discolor]AFK81039.1 NADH dehydrogenase subunit 6 [Trichuris discolor]